MTFDQAISHIQARCPETLAVLDGIHGGSSVPPKVPDFAAGMELHEKRMNYIDMRLAEITEKLRRLMGPQ
jgi:hypothetical protein